MAATIASQPIRNVDAEHMRGEWDREMRNGIELACGFVFGKIAGLILALTLTMPVATGRPVRTSVADLVGEAGWQWLWSIAILAAVVLFVRYAVKPCARLSYSESWQRKWTPHRRHRAWLIVAWIWALASVAVVVFAAIDSSPIWLVWFAPMLGGIAGATLWAGRRWTSGEEMCCARCGYLRDDPPPGQCPECGSHWLRPWKATLGQRGVNRPMLIAGFCASGGLILAIALAYFIHRPSI